MIDVNADGERNLVLAAQRLVVAPDASLDIEQIGFGGISSRRLRARSSAPSNGLRQA